MSVIVICGHCGKRELAYGWWDGQQAMIHHPRVDLPPARGAFFDEAREAVLRAHKEAGIHYSAKHGPNPKVYEHMMMDPKLRALPIESPAPRRGQPISEHYFPGEFSASCPEHLQVHTPLIALDVFRHSATRKVRAYAKHSV